MDRFLPADLSTMDFGDDPKPRQFNVRYGGKAYVAVEASEGAAVAYNNAMMRAMKMSGQGNITGVDGMAEVEPILVGHCLYEATPAGTLPLDQTGDPLASALVPPQAIRRWPSRVVKPIFDRIKAISDLGGEETEEALEKQVRDAQDRLAKYREGKARAGAAGGTPGNR